MEKTKLPEFRNERLSHALNNKMQAIPAIWFMRQAGRYQAAYRKLKEKYSFLELCKNPELAAQVALLPIQDFDFDVAILFSDILFPLDALGIGLDYAPGPTLSFHLKKESDFNQLRSLEDAKPFLDFQKKALQLTRKILPKHVSLIGFIGGPWTLFTYAASGKHEGILSFPKTEQKLRQMFFDRILPLLEYNIELQYDGGAELVMIFDTAAGDLDLRMFQELAILPLERLSSKFPNRIGYYAKGTTNHHLHLLEQVKGLAGFGVDHRFSMSDLLADKAHLGFLQGNFDQSLLFLNRVELNSALEAYLYPIKNLPLEKRKGWVSGLGHGILQHTPEDNVKFMVDKIREYLSLPT
jgi:uroporphyrinogen decarboxylase